MSHLQERQWMAVTWILAAWEHLSLYEGSSTDEDPLCSGCWYLNVSEGPREARGRWGSCWSLVTSLCHRLHQFTHICDANNCLLALCVWGSFAGELSGVHPLQSLWGRRQGDGMTCEEWHMGTLCQFVWSKFWRRQRNEQYEGLGVGAARQRYPKWGARLGSWGNGKKGLTGHGKEFGF